LNFTLNGCGFNLSCGGAANEHGPLTHINLAGTVGMVFDGEAAFGVSTLAPASDGAGVDALAFVQASGTGHVCRLGKRDEGLAFSQFEIHEIILDTWNRTPTSGR
jgi:hypothetical protein